MPVSALRSQDLLALHESVSDGTLELLYQPEVDLQTGAIVAMEGLLRWHHGAGVLGPSDFLEHAEDSGDMAPIGKWVIEQGAAEAARWRAAPGRPRQLFLNVSSSQLAADDFVETISDAIERHGLPKDCLGIEVTEAAIDMLGPTAPYLLAELRAIGVVLAIDDFGTWYSTLGALDELPINAVKIDQRFVRGVGGDVDGDTIVASVINLAHQRGLYVVAEGVESWAESARLTELGCDRAYGYLFASPQPAEKARWLLAQGAGWRAQDAVPAPRPRD
jgi:EAL domain-containing protein (putative c-di-GMP-specific phosphodiesterase class I)